MTALEIENLLFSKRDKNSPALLWVNHVRREAAVHDGECTHVVDYNEAMMARSNPAFSIIHMTDGETIFA
jgi:hypothetical protein